MLLARGLLGDKPKIRWEGGDDVKSVWLLHPGLHTCYNGRYNGKLTCEGAQILKIGPSSDWMSATRLHEAGIASKGVSATTP